jgi:hypothetical protein
MYTKKILSFVKVSLPGIDVMIFFKFGENSFQFGAKIGGFVPNTSRFAKSGS